VKGWHHQLFYTDGSEDGDRVASSAVLYWWF